MVNYRCHEKSKEQPLGFSSAVHWDLSQQASSGKAAAGCTQSKVHGRSVKTPLVPQGLDHLPAFFAGDSSSFHFRTSVSMMAHVHPREDPPPHVPFSAAEHALAGDGGSLHHVGAGAAGGDHAIHRCDHRPETP